MLFAAPNSKFHFLAPVYPMLFAAGSVATERLFKRHGRWRWSLSAYVAVLAISGVLVAPITVVPVLPVATLARITGALGGDAKSEVETREVAELPQNLADRFGWEDMTETVVRVHDRLAPEERSEACVLTGNYGEARAIDCFGDKHRLPKAISGHNSYYLWGLRGCGGETVVSVGVQRERLEEVFDRNERADTVRCRYCMPDEDDLPVYVCRDPKLSFEEAWLRFKHYGRYLVRPCTLSAALATWAGGRLPVRTPLPTATGGEIAAERGTGILGNHPARSREVSWTSQRYLTSSPRPFRSSSRPWSRPATISLSG